MSKATTDDSRDSITTDVFVDGVETAVRARSKYSRAVHKPVSDENGDVVYYATTDRTEPGPVKVVDEDHPDAQPRPECGLPTGDVVGIDFRTISTRNATNRDTCGHCTGTNGDPAEGAANKSFARIAIYGEDWGDE